MGCAHAKLHCMRVLCETMTCELGLGLPATTSVALLLLLKESMAVSVDARLASAPRATALGRAAAQAEQGCQRPARALRRRRRRRRRVQAHARRLPGAAALPPPVSSGEEAAERQDEARHGSMELRFAKLRRMRRTHVNSVPQRIFHSCKIRYRAPALLPAALHVA